MSRRAQSSTRIIGIMLIIVGVALGLYLGIWILFIGGIIGIIEEIQNMVNGIDVNGFVISVNIVKIIFASFVGWFSGLVLVLTGMNMVSKTL